MALAQRSRQAVGTDRRFFEPPDGRAFPCGFFLRMPSAAVHPHYLILAFQCLEPAPGVCLLGTACGLLKLDDQAVAAAVKQLSGKGWGETLDQASLIELLHGCGTTSDETVVDFLVEVGVLRATPFPGRRFRCLRIVHPSGAANEAGVLIEDLPFFTGLPLAASEWTAPIQPDEFVVLQLRRYDPDLIDALQRQVRGARTAAMITSYYAGRTHVIDAPFMPAEATPCHFCQVRTPHMAGARASHCTPTWMEALAAMQIPPSAVSGLDYPLRSSDFLLGQVLLRNRVIELLAPHGQPVHAAAVFQAIQTDLGTLAVQRGTPAVLLECDRCTP